MYDIVYILMYIYFFTSVHVFRCTLADNFSFILQIEFIHFYIAFWFLIEREACASAIAMIFDSLSCFFFLLFFVCVFDAPIYLLYTHTHTHILDRFYYFYVTFRRRSLAAYIFIFDLILWCARVYMYIFVYVHARARAPYDVFKEMFKKKKNKILLRIFLLFFLQIIIPNVEFQDFKYHKLFFWNGWRCLAREYVTRSTDNYNLCV